jgi:hypothetical protein
MEKSAAMMVVVGFVVHVRQFMLVAIWVSAFVNQSWLPMLAPAGIFLTVHICISLRMTTGRFSWTTLLLSPGYISLWTGAQPP